MSSHCGAHDESAGPRGAARSAHDFTDSQWREIEASLADRGVDLNAVKVGEFVPGKRW